MRGSRPAGVHKGSLVRVGVCNFPIPAARTLVARLRQEVGMTDERAFARDDVTYW